MNHPTSSRYTPLISDTHKAERAAMARAPRPRLAATILLVRGARGAEQVLMGLRSKRHDFMPNIYVYPGGRVDRADSYAHKHLGPDNNLNPRTAQILTTAMPQARARACVMAAIRETFEETGFVIGEPTQAPPPAPRHESWKQFYSHKHVPDLSRIEVIGRAVTPPYRPKRFDTWFFLCRLSDSEGARPFANSEELVETCWVNIHAQNEELKLHRITKLMLDAAAEFLTPKQRPQTIPYSRLVRGNYKLDEFPANNINKP